MRVLIFHGYLLSGTGSNVYNARLAEALVRLGHEVHLFSQDRHPERYPFVHAAGIWKAGSLRVRSLSAAPARCTVYRPDVGGLLPVYVADRYEGVRARTFLECDDGQIAAYVRSNVDAVREVARAVRPDVALANHLVMGPLILARSLAGIAPYAVKVHGSALEYTVKRDPQRFLAAAREGLAAASAVLVGSRHTAESLWATIADPALERRTRLGPPGVDVERFAPRDAARAAHGLKELAGRLRAASAHANGGSRSADAFARDERSAADALERVCDAAAGGDPLVAFVGKLIVSKGVDLLIACWPLVLAEMPGARLLIVGFGAYRQALERLVRALARGELDEARAIARAGRALERDPGATATSATATGAAATGATASPLRHLLAFLDSLSAAELRAYSAAARALPERVLFSGRLDHEELAELLPACSALVVPSTFPEAFGMVAAEAAACGVPPVSARHSGLAEVSDALAGALPAQARDWLSFAVDDSAVRGMAACVLSWLKAGHGLRAQARERLVEVVRERWSWEGVARGVIAAARGDLQALAAPRSDADARRAFE